jgi:hypothetical protein
VWFPVADFHLGSISVGAAESDVPAAPFFFTAGVPSELEQKKAEGVFTSAFLGQGVPLDSFSFCSRYFFHLAVTARRADSERSSADNFLAVFYRLLHPVLERTLWCT